MPKVKVVIGACAGFGLAFGGTALGIDAGLGGRLFDGGRSFLFLFVNARGLLARLLAASSSNTTSLHQYKQREGGREEHEHRGGQQGDEKRKRVGTPKDMTTGGGHLICGPWRRERGGGQNTTLYET